MTVVVEPIRYEVAHALPGRLRVRYPVSWLAHRREAIESQVRAVPGVRAVAASALTGSVRIEYDPRQVAETALVDELDRLGGGLDERPRRGRRAQASPVARRAARPTTTPLLALIGSSSAVAALWLPVPPVLAAALVLAAEFPVLARAAASVRRRRINGDVLEGATLLTLTARGSYLAAALLGWLRAAGEYAVARGLVTTRRSLQDLVDPGGRTAVRLEDGRPRAVPVAALRPGDVVVVQSGDQLPVDGVVVDGEALVSQQTMTGEALPVERGAGDRVFAATTVEHSAIYVRAERVGPDTAVGRIITAVEAAAEKKSELQAFAERIADRDVARTLGLAAIGAALSRSLDAGIAVLVSDYGLAARVGVPTALLTSMRRAAGEGILVKGQRALESLARVDTVVFDKTGTLTSGTPRVTRVTSYDPNLGELDIVRLAAAAERGSRHPVARAVARLAAEQDLEPPPADGASERVGLGADVVVQGRRVLVGSRRFMESQEVLLRAAARAEADALTVGASPIFVAVGGRLAGLLLLEDELRPDAPELIRALRARRMRDLILVTGDHPEPARVIAESLGFRRYHADLLPEDKARLIRDLKGESRVVAMVGDGVNDALALREADVGIAVAGGAVVATEAADVVLLRGGLERMVRALDLAAEAVGAVRRTLRVAGLANLGVGGLATLGLARPVPSILLSQGVTVATALAPAVRSSGHHPPVNKNATAT